MGGTGEGEPERDERRRAAEQLLISEPQRSDRSIAQACGLSSKLVAATRRRLAEGVPQPQARVGRDGRARPLDASAGRTRAAELLAERPAASLREIALAAGVSPGTVRDVRDRLRDGRSPVPQPAAARPPAEAPSPRPARRGAANPAPAQPRAAVTKPEWSQWLAVRAVDPEGWARLADVVPMSRVYVVADLARRFARNWEGIAEALDRRSGLPSN